MLPSKLFSAAKKCLAVFAIAAMSVLMFGCATYQDLTIQSVPSGAQITVDGTPYGPAPVKAHLMTDATGGVGPHEIVATKAGYREKKVSLQTSSFFFSDPHPFPDPVVIALDGQPTQTITAVPRKPVHAPEPHPQVQPKKESWR